MLSRLPTELQLAILEQLEPEECLHYALTSRSSWEASAPLITKYKTLFSELRSIQTVPGAHTLWDLLDRIIHNPSEADFVREVQIDADRALCWDIGVGGPESLTSTSLRPPPDAVARWSIACEQHWNEWSWEVPTINNELATGEAASFEAANAKGSDGVVVATVLCMLPNLRTLRYTNGGDDYWLLHALRYIVKDIEPSSSSYIPEPFKNLRHVSITHYGTEGHIRWAWAHCILRIPSLRTFTGHMVGGRWDDYAPDEELLDAPPNSSNVTEVDFENCSVEALAMDALLRLCGGLKSFRYSNGGALVGEGESYDARYFVRRAWMYLSGTLETLILDGEIDDNRAEDLEAGANTHPVYSLRSFEKLRVFACDLRDIVTGVETDIMAELKEDEFQDKGVTITTNNLPCIFNVRALFPKSLEELHIGCNDFNLSQEDRMAMLEELLKAKGSVLPNLRQVYLPVQDTPELEDFKTRAAAVGVEYKPNELIGKYDDIYRSVWM